MQATYSITNINAILTIAFLGDTTDFAFHGIFVWGKQLEELDGPAKIPFGKWKVNGKEIGGKRTDMQGKKEKKSNGKNSKLEKKLYLLGKESTTE